jgi:hypothetical protein
MAGKKETAFSRLMDRLAQAEETGRLSGGLADLASEVASEVDMDALTALVEFAENLEPLADALAEWRDIEDREERRDAKEEALDLIEQINGLWVGTAGTAEDITGILFNIQPIDDDF